MVRRATALTALVILSGILLQPPVRAQEARTHTVVRGETLWALARTYYDNPFEWRRIHEANRDQIEDPHWIYPGQVLTIPGIPPQVTQMEVRQPRAQEPMEAAGPCPAEGDRTVFYEGQGDGGPACPPGAPEDRTIFYGEAGQGMSGEIVGAEERPWRAVPRDLFYSASWLASLEREGDPPHLAKITEFRREGSEISTRTTARPYERLRLRMTGMDRPEEGDLLQTFRMGRAIKAGRVVTPTGLLTVTEQTDRGVVAVVTNEYARVQLGDMVRMAPPFEVEEGFGAEPLEGGPEGEIIGFAQEQEIPSLGHVGFVNLGSSDGLQVGDELEALDEDEEGWTPVVVGRLQVLLVQESQASFRIVHVASPGIREGTRVRVSGRLP